MMRAINDCKKRGVFITAEMRNWHADENDSQLGDEDDTDEETF